MKVIRSVLGKSSMRNGAFVLWLICLHSVQAQDFKTTILSMKNSFVNVQDLHVVLDIKVFDDSTNAKPYFSETADIKRSKQNYRNTMSAYEMLMNEKYLIVVNKNSKEILYSGRDLKNEKLLQAQFNLSLDSVFNILGNPIFKGKDGSVEHYVLKRKTGTIRQIDFFLNTEKNHMEKLEYRYREGQLVWITFKTFDVHPVFSGDTFNENNYLVFHDGVIEKSSSFKNYTIIQNESE
jgi:hypothetical protein